MLIQRPADIRPSEITPPELFHDRRRFLRLAAGAAVLGAWPGLAASGEKFPGLRRDFSVPEDKPTPYDALRATTISTNSAPARKTRPATP